MDIGFKFKALRESQNISVYRLSKLADVSENYIHAIEKNTNQPSVYILDKLLSKLGITISEFFNERDDIIYPTAYEKSLVHSARKLDKARADALLTIAQLLGNTTNSL